MYVCTVCCIYIICIHLQTVIYTSKEHHGQKEFPGGEKEAEGRVYGLLPSTIYTVSVQGECDNDPSIPPIIATNLIQTKDEDHPSESLEMSIRTYSYTYIHTHVCTYVCTYTEVPRLYVHTCICTINTSMYIYVCICVWSIK